MEFNAEKHTMEFFKKEWEIDESSLLYKRLSTLPEDKMCIALWAIFYTCENCHDADIGCHCCDDS